MSHENLSYIPEEMSATADSLKAFLNKQWQEHTRLFMDQPDSYHNLLAGLGHVFAKAASQGNSIGDAVAKYHLQYQNVYQALHTLADNIDQAAQAVTETDQSFSGLFQFQQEK